MDIALITGTMQDGSASGDELQAIAGAVDAPLTEALESRGLRVHHPTWHDPSVAWASYDLALVRTTWDYIDQRDAFVAWAARAGSQTRLWNPPEVLRWNTHKAYLRELEERGVAVVPTAWLAPGDQPDLGELLAHRGWKHAVIKPAVSSGSIGMLRVGLDVDVVPADEASAAASGAGEVDLATATRHLEGLLAAGDVLVQPYLAAVEDRGELSVVVVDGEVTHAVRKLPRAGEYRIQETFGGRYVVEEVDPEVATMARRIVAAADRPLLTVRVDLLEDDGRYLLTELEATEPDLFLTSVPEAAEPIVAAILGRVAGR